MAACSVARGFPVTVRGGGFTLLEVIVAMVVVSVLMSALYAGFRSAWQAQRSGSEAVERMQGAAEALRLLRSDLLGSFQPTASLGTYWRGERGGEGGLARLSMYTNTGLVEVDYGGLTARHLSGSVASGWPHQPIGGDVQQVVWEMRAEGEGTYTLVRGTTRNVLATETPALREQVILRGVRRLDARYYDGTTYHDAWDSALEGEQLPLAVELTLELGAGAGSPRRLTTVVALPMSEMDEELGGVRDD